MVKINFPLINAALDREHKEIELFLTQIAVDPSHTEKIIHVLSSYLRDHFDHEERFMEEIGYPQSLREDHSSSHKKLRDYFLKYFAYAKDDPEHATDLIDLATFLFVSHINTHDNMLSHWMTNHHISKTATEGISHD